MAHINNKGTTLIEIIVAMAIFGIISITFLNIFAGGYTSIFRAGLRTKAISELQLIIDNLNTDKYSDDAEIIAYFEGDPNGKTCKQVSDMADLEVKTVAFDVNYFIDSAESIVESDSLAVEGYQVTVLLFFNEGKDFVKATTVAVKGGA